MSGPGSAGDVWVSTLHSVSEASIDDAHNAWKTFVNAAITGHLAGWWAVTTQITEVVTDQLDPLTWKNTTQRVDALNIVGTNAGPAPSPRTCIVVGLRTNVATRAGRGRMFIPSMSPARYTGPGKFAAADCAAIATDFSNALIFMKTVTTPVIAHRKFRSWDNITRVTVGDVPGDQRRRTNKDVNNFSSAGV